MPLTISLFQNRGHVLANRQRLTVKFSLPLNMRLPVTAENSKGVGRLGVKNEKKKKKNETNKQTNKRRSWC